MLQDESILKYLLGVQYWLHDLNHWFLRFNACFKSLRNL